MFYIFTFSLSILFFLTSCAVESASTISHSRSIITYDNTNPIALEKAVNGLDLTQILPAPDFLGEGTIAVRSIEANIGNRLDKGALYMVEDNLITNLINEGYKVVERDPDALKSISRESDLKYKKNNPNFNALENEEFIETDLNAATYILSYRILECGVVYNEVLNNPKDVVERSSRTRLHCRLTNTKSSKIYAAGIVENEFTDLIYASDLENLKQISYQYYNHTLPLQYKDQDDGRTKINKGTMHKEVSEQTQEINDEPIAEDKGNYSLQKYLSIPLIILLFGSD